VKLICKILIIYIFSLLAFPCQDSFGYTCSHENGKTQNDHHENCPDDCHMCSPFCTCNCCHTNTIVAIENNNVTVEFVPVFFISLYIEDCYSDVLIPIWQPPKIS
jgi:hypothetical protein